MQKTIYSTMTMCILLGSSIMLSGCIAGKSQTIEIQTAKDGSNVYTMDKAELNTKNRRYRGTNIEKYKLGFTSKNNTITVQVNHELSFTQGTGTPILYHPYNPPGDPNDPKGFSDKRWHDERFWVGLKKADITGLNALSHSEVSYEKNPIFDWFTETISTTYNKQDFINFVKSHQNLQFSIKTHKQDITSNTQGISYIKKFVACLENGAMCKDKEESK